jgi:nickel/cobalt transporter (NiCoT) family protein
MAAQRGNEYRRTSLACLRRPSRRLRTSLRPAQWRALAAMAGVVAALHALGLLLLLAAVAHHHPAGASGAVAIGTGIAAYTLGLRHAFDADHISAIDNTTRQLMSAGRRPMSVGFFFSLGHSSVVFALALLLAAGARALGGQVHSSGSALQAVDGWVGPGVSGTFLYAIATLNIVVLVGIAKVLRELRSGRFDESELEAKLDARGLMNRFFGRFARAVREPWHMYPVGVLFGLGFDTASEVALLLLASGAAGAGLPLYAVLCLPILFAAGMSLLDTIDGSFMTLAYSWAFCKPVRKVYYNLTITGLSVLVALVVGTIELGGIIAQRAGAKGAFWSLLENIDLGDLGYIIAGTFVATWLLAVAVWHFGRVEQRWSSGRESPVAR